MTITLFPTSQSVKIAMTQPEYDLLASGVIQDPTMLERLLMSYCQQRQVAQRDEARGHVQELLERVDPVHLTEMIDSINERTKG